MTSRRAFEVAGEFAWRLRNRAKGNDLAQLVSDTFIDEGWGPFDPAAGWDWVSSSDWVAAGHAPQTGADPDDGWMSDDRFFALPQARDVPWEELGSCELSLAEGFVAMTEFVWRFSSRDRQNSIDDLLGILAPRSDGAVDAVAWRNWTESVGWVLSGNALRKCDWNDVLSVALYVKLPDGIAVPRSFFDVDPDSCEGGSRSARAQWVHLPRTRGFSDLGAELAPLVKDLRDLAAVDGVAIDVVVWFDPVGDPTGVFLDAAALAVLAPVLQDIWVEAEPFHERDPDLVDEIVVGVRGGDVVRFASNDANERQHLLRSSTADVLAASESGEIQIELIPRAGKAGLVILEPLLADIAAAGRGLRLVSRG